MRIGINSPVVVQLPGAFSPWEADAGISDLGAIADNLVAGLATYRSWAPPAWSPPTRTEMLVGLLQRFPRDGSWAHVALRGHALAGHVMARPDRDADGAPRAGAALLSQLFVREDHWGGGLAQALHACALEGMRERGLDRARLLVAARHDRARAFYRRCGWHASGRGETPGELGLELVEYELAL
ncbi:MAG: N-acetyltransferase family protein [Vicinamibacteria bacterium]